MSIWPGSFQSALDLSKVTLKKYGLLIALTFLFGFGLSLFLEQPFAAPQASTDDTLRIITQVTGMLWGVVQGVLLFYFTATAPLASALLAHQRQEDWDKETWVSLVAESMRALGWTLLWTIALIIPGVIQYILFTFVPYIVIFSLHYRQGEVDALKLSKALIKPMFFKMTGLTILITVATGIFVLASQMFEVLSPLPIRFVLEGIGFLITLYGYSLIRILFHRSLIAYYGALK